MSSDQRESNKITMHESDFERDKNAMERDRREAERMMSIYTGYDDGSWDPFERSTIRSEGKHVPQYNIVKPKMKNLAGHLSKDFIDKDFIPVSNDVTPYTRTVKGMFLSDKGLMEYDRSHANCLMNGLIHQGIEYMYIDTRFDPIGNIAFKSLNPANVIIDPNWKTNVTNEIEVIWTAKYMTAKQIKTAYGHKSDRIDDLIKSQMLHGLTRAFDGDDTVMQYGDMETYYGDVHRVVEKHYIKTAGRDVEYVVVGQDEIELPEGTEDEQEEVFERNNPQSDGGVKIKRRIYDREYWITASCATLDPSEFLEDRKAEIQIERLPFFPWSADRFNGRNCGLVSLLEDPQNQLNRREYLATEMMDSSAHGAHLVDPAVFGGEMPLARKAIEDFNKPDAKIFTMPGALASGQRYIQEIPKTQFQGEIYQDISRMQGYIEQLSGQTASLDGTKESSHDTGILMQKRITQATIALAILYKGIELHELEKTTAWLDLAKQLYSKNYREFNPRGGEFGKDGEVITVNQRVYTEEGVDITLNIDKMPKFKVVVTQSKQGLTVREHDRSVNLELLNVVSSPTKRLKIEENIMNTLNDSEEDKEAMKKISELEMAVAVKELEFKAIELEANKVQLQQQLQQGEQATEQAGLQNQQAQQQIQQEQPVQ